jgi:hypothetical protein
MVRRNKKGHRAVEVANPHFGGAAVEVQGALFVDFSARIGRRNDLNTDLGGVAEELRIFSDLWAVGSEPADVDSLDAIGGGHWALC